MSRPPRIGVTTYLERARYGSWDHRAALLPVSYVDAVVRAGGVPLLLPPVGHAYEELLDALDGLVLAGGADLDPSRYGDTPDPRTAGVRPARDAFEFPLVRAALARDLPVLAVCRGMQVLNVALGGTLHQHLPDVVGHEQHRPAPGVFGTSTIALRQATRLAGVLGAETTVSCHHHQGLDRLGAGLQAVGWTEDGTVEAVEVPGRRFVAGIQWHPEEDGDDLRLFAALVEAATPVWTTPESVSEETAT